MISLLIYLMRDKIRLIKSARLNNARFLNGNTIDYSSSIALIGQTDSQTPQSIQVLGSIT